MVSPLYKVNTRVRELRPYALIPERATVKINRNENPWLDPQFIYNELLKRDILIRDVSRYPMLQNFFRVSVGTPAENNLLLSALAEISRDCW